MDRDLSQRTKQFALRIIKLSSALPKRGAAQVLGNQVLKSGTSPGAHYREARRAKSDADFISKIEGALQELDETHNLGFVAALLALLLLRIDLPWTRDRSRWWTFNA